MAPLSILPGRIRFHAEYLHGRAASCQRFETEIAPLEGVLSVSANHRTGRVLIRFDETVLDRQRIAEEIDLRLAAVEDVAEPDATVARRTRSSHAALGHAPSGMGRQILREAVTHVLLPSPFDLLLPTAAAVLRR